MSSSAHSSIRFRQSTAEPTLRRRHSPPSNTGRSILLVVVAAAHLLVAPEPAAAAPADHQYEVSSVRAAIDAGRYDEAERKLQSILEHRDSRTNPPTEALILLVETLWRRGRASEDSTLALARRAVEIDEAAHGRAHLVTSSSLRWLGTVLTARGELDEANAVLTRAHRIRQSIYGSQHLDVAEILHCLAALELKRGDLATAGPLLSQCQDIRQRALGTDHILVAGVLNDVGIYKYRLGKFDEAREAWERVLHIRERTLGPEHRDVGAVANNLGLLQAEVGNFKAAQEMFGRALGISEKALGPDHVDLAAILSNLANAARDLRQLDEAAEFYERALRLRESTSGPNHPELCWTLSNFGWLRLYQGRYREARALCERSLAIREASVGADSPYLAYDLRSLAAMLDAAGEYSEAIPLLERAVALQEASLPPDSPYLAETLSLLAWAVLRSGDSIRAASLYERGLQIGSKTHGAIGQWVWGQLRDYGTLLSRIGDFGEALDKYERALSGAEQSQGSDSPTYAHLLCLIGTVLARMGQHEVALQRYDAALSILSAHQDADPRETGRALAGLAHLYVERADWDKAEGYAREALKIQQLAHADAPVHDDVALAALNLAEVLVGTRAFDEAGRMFTMALSIADSVYGRDHPAQVSYASKYANYLLRTGQWSTALDVALRAARLGREHLALMAQSLPERQALTLAMERPRPEFELLTLAAGQVLRGRAADIWDAQIRSRALVTDAMASRHRAVSGALRVAAVAAEFAQANQRLANLLVRKPVDASAHSHVALVAEARREREQAERRLAELSGTFQTEQLARRVGYNEVAAAVPAGAALVAYVKYEKQLSPGEHQALLESIPARNTHARWMARHPSLDSYLAFVLVGGESEPIVVPLGASGPIDEAIRQWLRAAALIDDPAADRLQQAEQEYVQVGRGLRELVWAPIAPHLPTARQVWVVPDGDVQLVNFAALPAGDGRYMVEEALLFRYLTCERDLLRFGEPKVDRSALLAVGGVDFDEQSVATDASLVAAQPSGEPSIARRGSSSECVSLNDLRFAALPGSGQEAARVVGIWGTAHRDTGAPVAHLSGSSATETAVKSRLMNSSIAHLATHGFFLTRDCLAQSDLRRGVGQVVGFAPPSDPVEASPGPGLELATKVPNSMHLAGLALAGVNRRNAAATHVDDGVLLAEEVAALDLSQLDLVVLSACDTGVGTVAPGEGVFGLRRAFQVAGAGSLVMSLWSVDDQATREWMYSFYRKKLLEKRDAAESVRAASLDVLRERRRQGTSTHPFFWGAFVAVGVERTD